MAVTVSQLETYLSAAASAAASGDHATRLANLRAARDIVTGLPRTSVGGASASYPSPNDLDRGIADAIRAISAGKAASATTLFGRFKHKRVNEE